MRKGTRPPLEVYVWLFGFFVCILVFLLWTTYGRGHASKSPSSHNGPWWRHWQALYWLGPRGGVIEKDSCARVFSKQLRDVGTIDLRGPSSEHSAPFRPSSWLSFSCCCNCRAFRLVLPACHPGILPLIWLLRHYGEARTIISERHEARQRHKAAKA